MSSRYKIAHISVDYYLSHKRNQLIDYYQGLSLLFPVEKGNHFEIKNLKSN